MCKVRYMFHKQVIRIHNWSPTLDITIYLDRTWEEIEDVFVNGLLKVQDIHYEINREQNTIVFKEAIEYQSLIVIKFMYKYEEW